MEAASSQGLPLLQRGPQSLLPGPPCQDPEIKPSLAELPGLGGDPGTSAPATPTQIATFSSERPASPVRLWLQWGGQVCLPRLPAHGRRSLGACGLWRDLRPYLTDEKTEALGGPLLLGRDSQNVRQRWEPGSPRPGQLPLNTTCNLETGIPGRLISEQFGGDQMRERSDDNVHVGGSVPEAGCLQLKTYHLEWASPTHPMQAAQGLLIPGTRCHSCPARKGCGASFEGHSPTGQDRPPESPRTGAGPREGLPSPSCPLSACARTSRG